MKLALLATDSSSTWMMVNALRENYPDINVVIEKPISRLMLLKRRIVRIGFVDVIGQILFMLYLPLLRFLTKKHIHSIEVNACLATERPAGIIITRFESINSQECIDWLRNESPAIVILNGTRIVSSELLGSCNAIFFNIHCGITPAYRGVHGGYWALVRGDISNVGVTVHLVDVGIDTGNIIYQTAIKIDGKDNFLTYPVKQYVEGIPLMKQAIADVIAGNLRTYQRDDLSSAIWYHPTLWQYLWVRLTRGIG